LTQSISNKPSWAFCSGGHPRAGWKEVLERIGFGLPILTVLNRCKSLGDWAFRQQEVPTECLRTDDCPDRNAGAGYRA